MSFASHTVIVLVPLAQRIARWTSNPKVLGSIPRWDDLYFLTFVACTYVRVVHSVQLQLSLVLSLP